MAFILNIETATRNCSVSVAKNGYTLAVKEYAGEGYTHAEKLHVFIQDVLQQAGITTADLNAVAVSMGPGSYTGLRIGVSAAKGLCYALGIPLIAIDTLELLARKIKVQEGFIAPMIDARRMEVYTAIFDKEYNKVREIKAEIITDTAFSEIGQAINLVGDGAVKCRTVLNESKFIFNDNILFPSAEQMGELSFARYKISDTVDVAYFEPFYLKDFIAVK